MVEGPKLLGEALASGSVPEVVYLDPSGLEACDLAERARAAQRIHDVIEGAEQREAAEVERLLAHLCQSSKNLLLLLRQPAGVRAVIQEFSIL